MDRAMKQLVSSTKRVKAGNGQAAATTRRVVFVQAYMANGHNATQAAITAGFSAKTAYSQGQRLLKHVEVSGQLTEMAREAGNAAGLTVERVLEEVRRLSFSDPRKLFRKDGTPIPITELDDDTAAMISAIEVDADGRLTRIRLWDKNAALEKAMKHLGLYNRDNIRRSENLSLQVLLVGAPTNEGE
jgi:phage terminase small subunit